MIQADVLSTNRKVSIMLVLFGAFFQMVPIGAVALLLPRIRDDLGMTFAQAGSLSASVMLVYGAMQIPVGYMADKFNPRKLFFIGAICTTVLTVAFGLVQQYWQAITIQALDGITQSLIFLPGAILMMRMFPPRQRASALSILALGLYIGLVVVNLIGPALAPGSEWRPVFLYFGTAGIIVSLIYLAIGKDVPRDVKVPRISASDIATVLKSKFMWLCNGMQFARVAVYFGVTSWIPAYLMVELGLSLQVTGIIVVGQFILIALGNTMGGMLSDKWHRPVTVVASSFAVMLITILLLAFVHDIIIVVIVLMILSLFIAAGAGPIFSMPIDILGSTAAGTITGMGNLFANIGGFIFTILLGSLKDATGLFQTGFYAMAAACCVGLILTLVAAKFRRQHLAKTIVDLNN
jgi:sugar phosphate permease